ncbi:MAG: bifunctional serine/threonine-protein kinase/formylglycine-generating enzyme family protein [Blastocatellia bacterium]
MTPERYQRISAIVDGALDLPECERDRFVELKCAGDEDLREHVTRLLEAEKRHDSFLDVPAFEVAARDAAEHHIDSLIGRHLGPYRIDSLLGVGGMGEVFRAEDTRLNRPVALKLLPTSASFDEAARRRFLREARAASALSNSGIVTIHSIERVDGRDAIVMEYVAGETLRQLIDRGPLPLKRVVAIGSQVANAIAVAHEAGLVHRDLKPSNILITEDGQAKVVDFGLAKRFRVPDGEADPVATITEVGLIMGTAAYMSPEQTRGEDLDGRSDIFSLGCVIYEAATGHRPFGGKTVPSILVSIITKEPPVPSSLREDLPAGFDEFVARALAKEREDRFSSATEMRDNLIALESPNLNPAGPAVRRPRWAIAIAAAALLVIVGAGLWYVWRQRSIAWARNAVVEAERLAHDEKYFEAFELLSQAEGYLSGDPSVARLLPVVTDDLSVKTAPAGATVYLRRFDPGRPDHEPVRELIGSTPIEHLLTGRADYILEIEKDGFVPVRRTISSALDRVQSAALGPVGLRRRVETVEPESERPRVFLDADAPIVIDVALVESGGVPERMVPVAGGEYRLLGYGRPSLATVQLDPYFIDTFEVSNAEFREFIRAGGYLKKEYWRHPFRLDGRVLSWDEAMARFRDRTDLPGPRIWSNQTFPDGESAHPVTDVSWYEAAAYAEFRGKRLPTIFQWEKAARNGAVTVGDGFIMPWGLGRSWQGRDARANYLGSGTAPVESRPFGMSSFGCFNMAGNVAEWCVNSTDAGFTTAGGSWKDPLYLFSSYGAFPGAFASSALGFRCVLVPEPAAGDQGGMPLRPDADVPRYTPPSDAANAAMLRHYTYDRTPLDARVVDVVDTADWRREKIEYVGAGGGTAVAYLYLPRNVALPVQVIHYIPTDAAYYGFTVPDEVEAATAAYIKSGRAVFAVVLEGYRERPVQSGSPIPSRDTIAFREFMVRWATDHARGIDYLETRPEIDPSRIASLSMSVNTRKITLVSIERRYRSVVMVGAGLLTTWTNIIPECNGANFASFMTAPKLMIHGRYDEMVTLRTEAEPLFALLREPKELKLVDDGHIPPLEVTVPIVNRWLDETMGPVRRE